MKIDSLTKAQEKELIKYREEWLTIGRSCEKADRPRAEKALIKMYQLLGKKNPRFWWNDGPAVGSIVRTLILNKAAKLNLGANLRDNLWANLGDNLGANLGANLRDNLWANLGDNLGDNLCWNFWGQHAAAFPAYYFFPHQKIKKMHTAEQIEKLECWSELSNSCGWWEPFEEIVFVCERPKKQAVDNRGRLHCDDGPALLCRDGWPVYAVHGTRLPAWIIEEPKKIDTKKIDSENNAEIRRVMIDKFGKDRYIKESGAKQIAKDDFGILWEKELTGDEPLTMVEVLNSTPEQDGSFKTYFLRVNRECRPLLEDQKMGNPQNRTPLNAIASTFGKTGDEYLLEQQT